MNRLLTVRDLCDLLTITYPTIYRWIKDGTFPEPVNGRKKKLLWSKDSIEEWMNRNQQSTPDNTVSHKVDTPAKQQKREAKSFEQRQTAARQVLERHRKTKGKEGGEK